MAGRILSEGHRKGGSQANTTRDKQGEESGNQDYRTAEDKRVDADKWMYRDNYKELTRAGTLLPHRGNPSGVTRSTYWPDREGKAHNDPAMEDTKQTRKHTIEALQQLWIKEDSMWDTQAVFGPYRKQLRLFSDTYQQRRIKLLGHVIRASDDDPMRKVTFRPGTIKPWGTPVRRVGRPRMQWLRGAKTQAWKKLRHMEDTQGSDKPYKRKKYKGKKLQEAYLHLWAEDREY